MKRIVSVVVMALLAALPVLSACGGGGGGGGWGPGGADDRPEPPVAQSDEPRREPEPIRPTAKRYSWGLPIGDVSPNYNERDVYESLHDNDCKGAQSKLDAEDYWQRFTSPRNVLLAQAAIEFCKGNFDAGKRWFNRAKAMGWSGLLIDDKRAHASCEFYLSASSLIEQRPRSDFRCPKGEPPKWKEEFEPDRRDPRAVSAS